MAKPILYYTNEQSLRLFKKQREKELDNELKQLEKNERFRLGEIYTEEEADTLAQLYKKTMEKVGIFKKEPTSLSLEANIKKLIKEKEKEKLLLGTLPSLTTPEPIIAKKPLPLPKDLLTGDILKPTPPIITPEMINSVLSKFKPIDETKINEAIKKNAEEFKNNSNNSLNNLLMDELKNKLLKINQKKNKDYLNEINTGVINKMRQVSELEQMAENDKNVENVVEQVLKQSINDLDSQASTIGTSLSGQPKGMTLNEQLLQLYGLESRGNNFYKNLKDRINSIQSVSDKKNSQKILEEQYKKVVGSDKGWANKNPKTAQEAQTIIDNYIKMGGKGIMKKRKLSTTKKFRTYRK
jgi:hypothetical protein